MSPNKKQLDYKKVKAKNLKEGDRVDLKSCPYLKNHPSAEYELAIVEEVERETDGCVAIYYSDINAVGYDPEVELLVVVE